MMAAAVSADGAGATGVHAWATEPPGWRDRVRPELGEIADCCKGILEETTGVLTWAWDDYIGAMLAVFKVGQAKKIAAVLDKQFTSRWDCNTIEKAPKSVQEIAKGIGGLRETQHLLATRPEQTLMSYGAWWPWGDGETISIRIGLVMTGVSDYDVGIFNAEFKELFPGNE